MAMQGQQLHHTAGHPRRTFQSISDYGLASESDSGSDVSFDALSLSDIPSLRDFNEPGAHHLKLSGSQSIGSVSHLKHHTTKHHRAALRHAGVFKGSTCDMSVKGNQNSYHGSSVIA